MYVLSTVHNWQPHAKKRYAHAKKTYALFLGFMEWHHGNNFL